MLLQVARWGNPTHSALVIQEVRKKVGFHIDIRADANRRWTYEEAMEFSSFVKDCGLQYIEVDYSFINNYDYPLFVYACLVWYHAIFLDLLTKSLLQEPVQDEDEILKFCEESGLPVALDETIDGIHENHLEKLAKFSQIGRAHV